MRIDANAIALDTTAPPADRARIDTVSRDFEAQFARMMVKSMRDASFGDSMFPGENQLYRDMYDQQIAGQLTKGRGLGLAPLIAKQLSGSTPSTTTTAAASTTANAPGVTRRSVRAQASAPAYSLAEYTRPPAAQPFALKTSSHAAVAFPSRPTATRVTDIEDTSHTYSNTSRLALARLREMQAAVSGKADADDIASTLPYYTAKLRGPEARGSDALDARTPETFVASVWSHAQRAGAELGVDPKVLVAQAALETGWGKRLIHGGGQSANNLFGIKATGRWSGASAKNLTTEVTNGVAHKEMASFRAYGSAADSFDDYVNLLKTNPRYRDALAVAGDGRQYAGALQRAGYATDPAYAAKITAIAEGPTMRRAIASVAARTPSGHEG